MDPIDGIVVGGTDLGEADRLVRLLTASEGRIAVVARRARNSRRHAGAFELGTRLRVLRGRSRGGLAPVQDAERLDGPLRARAEVERIALVGYGCELCAALAPEGGPAEKLYRLLEAWLALLEGPERPGPPSRWALEAKAATFAGLAPALAACAACGERLTDPAVFDPESGGGLHARCGGGRPVPAAALLALEALRRTPLVQTVGARVTEGPPWLLADFLQHQLSRPLQSRALLEAVTG